MPSVQFEDMDATDAPQSPESFSSEEEDKSAPTYQIPSTRLAALEHPCVVMDLDNAMKTFGSQPQFQSVSEDETPLAVTVTNFKRR